MKLFSSLLFFLLLVSASCQTIRLRREDLRPDDLYNYFKFPYRDNAQTEFNWPIGASHNITWMTNFTEFELVLFHLLYRDKFENNEGKTIHADKNPNTPGYPAPIYYSWTVDKYEFNIDTEPNFYFAIWDRSIWYYSHPFKITPNISNSSSPSHCSVATSTPEPGSENHHHQNNIALGVGLGLGLPALLLFGIFVGMKMDRSRRLGGIPAVDPQSSWAMSPPPITPSSSAMPPTSPPISPSMSSYYPTSTPVPFAPYGDMRLGNGPVELGEETSGVRK